MQSQSPSFTTTMAIHHAPALSFTSSLDCDAIVRTSTSFATARDFVSHALSAHSQLQLLQLVPANESPPLGLDATRALHSALESAPDDVKAVNAFTDALEQVTAVARHTYIRDPVISLHASWVAQPGFAPPPAHDANSHLLLFVRTSSRHDDAALSNALPIALSQLGHDRVHVVRLPQRSRSQDDQNAKGENQDEETNGVSRDGNNGNESIAGVAVRLIELARKLSNRRTDTAAASADRARRATRTSFRSWFSGTSSSTSPLLLPDDMNTSFVSTSPLTSSSSALSSTATAAATSTTRGGSSSPMSYPSTASGLSTSPSSRRGSFSAALHAPQFDPSSAEGLARRYADYAFVAGRYSEAADAYAQLAIDCRSLTGLASVHEASAHEMTGLSRAMLHAPPVAVTPSFERAIAAYTRAVRPELAVRVAFRAAALLTPNSIDHAAAFLIRTRDSIAPSIGATASATGSAFVDAALAVIAMKCVHICLLRSPKWPRGRSQSANRRASLYAFIAMIRLSALGHAHLAGRLADLVTPSASEGRPTVEHHVSLARANAAAESGQIRQAVALFSSTFSSFSENTDVELQGAAVRAFIRCIGDGISHRLPKSWDSGAVFPVVPEADARVITMDSNPDECGSEVEQWTQLEDDVLEDWEWARLAKKKATAKRERRPETIITQLRREPAENAKHKQKNIGGSLEMKIRRIRELAQSRRTAARERSLLVRSSVIGERVTLRVTLTNSLQFPVFVDDVRAVATIDGRLYFQRSFDSDLDSSIISDCTSNSNSETNFNPKSNNHPSNSDSDLDEKAKAIELQPLDGIVLKPSESQTLDLHVVPKVAGNLRFVGATWRFTIGMGSASPRAASAVPGFALLQKRGPRLNHTRRQRAADPPLYEDDVSLLLRVVSDAPRISAELNFDCTNNDNSNNQPQTTRAGEIRRANLVLRNVGKVPVHEITYRVPAPYDVFVDVQPTTYGDQQNIRQLALGSDDIQLRDNDACVSATTAIDLQPGETVSLPSWVKTSIPSNAFVRRTRYQLTSNGMGMDDSAIPWNGKVAIAYGTNQARVARAQIHSNVRCSINASPRFMRESDVPSCGVGVLLGIEVEHAGRASEDATRFDVSRINVASNAPWKSVPLPEPNYPDGKPKKESIPSVSSLLINETATVFTFIARDENKSSCLDDERNWRCNGIIIGSHPADGSNDEFRRAARHFLLSKRHAWQSLPADHEMGEWAFVSVEWRGSNGAMGDIHLAPIDPTKWIGRADASRNNATTTSLSSPTASISSTEAPVLVQVSHAAELEHNFSQDPLLKRPATQHHHVFPAVVDVKVAITNISSNLVDVMVSAPPVGGIADGDRGRHWAGDVAVTLHSLPPKATRTVNLTAILVTPGSFNLAKFAVAVQSSGFRITRSRQMIKIPPSFITIKDEVPSVSKQDVVRSSSDSLAD